MPLQQDYDTPSTGAVASYHVVQQVSIDYVSNLVGATVASYLSKDARDAGKFAMYTQQIQLQGLPEAGTDALAYAEAQLSAVVPTDGSVVPGFPNRYAFAGATVVE
ncbi:hypothetical protein LMG27952_03156 [Paraburkholderia hiiakae]|uniref:Uncharacterized protein n=1 Tax=Paraburkholderia hiiakae TaxID=1081782 RepID=A0ABN7HWS5_9BURK|nr:hypothetical protein [Paraburkholderia hiiakae]CAD6536487.1 hypothetical protein LMG27952_03156 [Paraburkholderia hiiakae]